MPFDPHLFPEPLPSTSLPEYFQEDLKKKHPKLGSNYKVLGGLKAGPIQEDSILDDDQQYNCLGFVVDKQKVLADERWWRDPLFTRIRKF